MSTVIDVEGLTKRSGAHLAVDDVGFGRMQVLGLDPRTAGSQLRALVGSQLQESALPDRLRVEEAVLLFGESDRRSAHLLLET